MSLFRQPEWDNFARASGRRPWLWPGYGWQLSRLALRRLANTSRVKLAGSNHRGLKRRPEWLDTDGLAARGDTLSFPSYSARQDLPALPAETQQFEARDPEGYFFQHRWANCLVAALGTEAAAAAALADVLAWMRNPPPKSDAAWETYSSCERVTNLAVMLSVHADCRRIAQAEHAAEIGAFFAESLRWIDSRLEYYGAARTNNHILNNARALVIAGSVLGDEAAIERGLLLFERMSRLLFQPGGFLRERSSHYQCVVTNWMLDVLHFARAVPAELEALGKRVSAATALLLAAGEGLDTQIGDISPDCSPASATRRLRCLYAAALAGLDSSPDARLDDWMFVSRGKHRLLACGLPREYPFDYNTHGHADLCGFVWAYDRRPVLVDAGRASYLDDARTRLQCGPAGHNGLTVQDLPPLCDSLLTNGRWCPRPYAQAEIRFEHRSGAGILIEHDGFGRIPGVGRHARSILIEGDELSVLDELGGAGSVDIEMFWHFAPGFQPSGGSVGAVTGRGLRVAVGGTDGARLVWEEYPYSAAYGDVQKAFMLRVRRTVALPWSLKTMLQATPCAE